MADTDRKRGDRHDAARVRDVDALHAIMPHLMRNRTEAEVFTTLQLDVTEVLRMIDRLNSGSERKTTFFHCALAAVAKTVKLRPDLNMYVSGRRYYRRHRVSLAFIAKKNFSDGSKESVVILDAGDDWTLETFRDRVLEEVDQTRRSGNYGVDGTLETFRRLPRCIAMAFMGLVRFLDFYNMAPRSLSKGDPNYASVLLTNLGSIKGPAIYHHLNDYGTNSIIVAVGTIHKAPVADDEGNVSVRDVVDVGVTIDERIADGVYFIRSLNLLKHIMENPDLLNRPLTEEFEYEQ